MTVSNGMEELHIGLCASRHRMPVENFIWSQIDNPMEFDELERNAWDWLLNNMDHEDPPEVYLYVTGLTVALTSFMKSWGRYSQTYGTTPRLILMHHDRDTDTYRPQWMF